MIRGYLDNAATTETKFFAKDFYIPGNPNSPTAIGRKAHDELTKARERIKEHLGVKGGKVIIGGTASQLMEAIVNCTDWDKYRSFGSRYEHDSIIKYVNYELSDIKELSSVLYDIKNSGARMGPTFVAWMLTNNITGTVYNTKEIGRLCHRYGAYYIMDCTASIGHNSLDGDIESYCDCVLTSSHKFHGPSGIGCMWVSDRFANFLGLTDDDHDEYGLIPGTPDVSGAVAMSYAMEHAIQSFDVNHYVRLASHMNNRLDDEGIFYKYVSPSENFTSVINAITLPGFNADALVQYLSSRGVYISAGHSACSGDSPDASRVLEAFGLSKEEASQTVRISFCEDSTISDIDMLVDGIVSFKEKFM